MYRSTHGIVIVRENLGRVNGRNNILLQHFCIDEDEKVGRQ